MDGKSRRGGRLSEWNDGSRGGKTTVSRPATSWTPSRAAHIELQKVDSRGARARARASRSIVLKGSQKYVKAHVLPNKALAVKIFVNIVERQRRQGSRKSARRISIKMGRRNNDMKTKETRCSAVEGTVFSRFHLTNSLFRVPFRWHRKAKEALEGIEIFPRPICSLFLACRRPSPTPPSTTRHIVA